jgi:Fe2+ transport system protein FeoA
MTRPLSQLQPGATGWVHALTGGPDFCQRVRELGFAESTLVRLISGRGPFLCQVNGARIAVGAAAAAQIVVAPLAGERPAPQEVRMS